VLGAEGWVIPYVRCKLLERPFLCVKFILFNLCLCLGAFLASMISNAVTGLSMGPLLLALSISKSDKPSPAMILLIGILPIAVMLYLLGLWSAVCVAFTFEITQWATVTWDWVYWLCALFWSGSLVRSLIGGQRDLSSPEEMRRSAPLNNAFAIFATCTFVGFALFPRIALWPYGWILNLFGLAKYME
jgi:hypothetical protein